MATIVEQNSVKIKAKVIELHSELNGKKVLDFSKTENFEQDKITLANGEEKPLRDAILGQLPTIIQKLDSLRLGGEKKLPVDAKFSACIKDFFGFQNTDDLMRIGLGIDGNETTFASLSNMGDIPENARWLQQETFLDAVRLGFEQPNIWTGLTARTRPVKGSLVTMPFINIADATPVKLGELETIPMGSISFGQKSVGIFKYGIGYEISDAIKELPINSLGIFLEDFGEQMNWGLNSEALRVLINGEQLDGSASSAVVGVQSANVLAYTDLLLFKSRMARMNRTPSTWIMSEVTFTTLFNVPEVKGYNGGTRLFNFNVSNLPIPKETNIIITSVIPDGKILMVDTTKALEKLDKQALRIEMTRDASKQVDKYYLSFQTAFSSVYRDARVMMDYTNTNTSLPFPSFLDPSVVEKRSFGARGSR